VPAGTSVADIGIAVAVPDGTEKRTAAITRPDARRRAELRGYA
jgi:hypothetical protein